MCLQRNKSTGNAVGAEELERSDAKEAGFVKDNLNSYWN